MLDVVNVSETDEGIRTCIEHYPNNKAKQLTM